MAAHCSGCVFTMCVFIAVCVHLGWVKCRALIPSMGHHTWPRHFHFHFHFLFMKCCVGFTSDVTWHTPSKKFNFCCISPQNICPKVLGIIKIYFGKCETSLCVLFGQQWLLPWNSPMDAFFAQSLSLTLIEASEACSSLDVVLGSFMTSWMSCRCALGVILVGWPLLGRFTTVPSFLHLWIMALTVVRWSPKAFINGFITLSRLIHVNYFISHLFLNFGMICCSLSMLHFVRQVLFKWFLDSTGLAVIRPGCGWWNSKIS